MRRTLCAFLILTVVSTFCACQTATEKYNDSISEFRQTLMMGQNGDYEVELISGYRENPFKIDGLTEERINYSLVTIKATDLTLPSIEVTVTVGESEWKGEAVRHPFEQSYSFEVREAVFANEAVVTVGTGDSAVEICLSNVRADGQIEGERALEIALDGLSDALSEYKNGSKFMGEIFVRYVPNPISTKQRFYWYVAFIPRDDNQRIIAVLINPDSGRIEAKREE